MKTQTNTANEYDQQAADFLAKHGLKMRITLSDSKTCPWDSSSTDVPPAHTPTPWAVVSPVAGQFAIVPASRTRSPEHWTLAYIRDFQANDEANANHIVECVNVHAAHLAKIQALTEALQNLLEDTGIKDAIWLVESKPGDEVDDEDARTMACVSDARAALSLPSAPLGS
jgi:hypothetical protein